MDGLVRTDIQSRAENGRTKRDKDVPLPRMNRRCHKKEEGFGSTLSFVLELLFLVTD
jgi:hypothetical protein